MKVKAKAIEELDVVRTGASIVVQDVPGATEEDPPVPTLHLSVQFKVGGEQFSACEPMTSKEAGDFEAMSDRIVAAKLAADGKFEAVA